MAVAGATLILATATVLLAVYTRRSLEQGREELTVAQNTLKAAELQAITSGEQVAATLEQVKVSQGQASTARDALERATETQTIAAIMPIYDRWREFSKIRIRLDRGELNLDTIDDTPEGFDLRTYFGYLELICILVLSGQVQFDVADKVWPTAFRDAYRAGKPYIDRRRKAKPFFARYLQQFVEKQGQEGTAQ